MQQLSRSSRNPQNENADRIMPDERHWTASAALLDRASSELSGCVHNHAACGNRELEEGTLADGDDVANSGVSFHEAASEYFILFLVAEWIVLGFGYYAV